MTPHDRLHRLAQPQHGVWTLEQARSCGFADRTVRHHVERGAWRAWFDGPVYSAAGTPPAVLTRLSAARLRVGDDAVVARRSAARVWELPGFDRSEALELVVLREHTPRCPGLHVARTVRLPASSIVRHSGLPITDVSRTLHDLASVVDDHQLLVAAAEGWRLGRTDPMRLLAEVHARRRFPGNARMRRVIERLDPRLARTRSVAEIVTQIHLVDLGYTDVQVNVRRRLSSGRWVELDILLGDRHVLEVLGARWHASVIDRAGDALRTAEIEADGFVVGELWADELHDAARVHEVVTALLARTPT